MGSVALLGRLGGFSDQVLQALQFALHVLLMGCSRDATGSFSACLDLAFALADLSL
jgi:hypothetical protein